LWSPALSAQARYVAFQSSEPDSNYSNVFVAGADATDTSADLTGDHDLDDVVLRAFDTSTAQLSTLCPAETVSVAGDAVLFLRPEAAGDARGCPAGPDLNGDGDTNDNVVHLLRAGGPVQNLGQAASAIALSPSWIAALVS